MFSKNYRNIENINKNNKFIRFIDNINVIFDDDFNNDDHSIYKINFIINKYRKLAKELKFCQPQSHKL